MEMKTSPGPLAASIPWSKRKVNIISPANKAIPVSSTSTQTLEVKTLVFLEENEA